MRNVYENVELIRYKRGITKRKMASDAKISDMACTRLLSGESKMSVEILKSFAHTLGITDMNIFFDDSLTDSVITAPKEKQFA
jgi:transcriptional regulator with XRE-family HTH domain